MIFLAIISLSAFFVFSNSIETTGPDIGANQVQTGTLEGTTWYWSSYAPASGLVKIDEPSKYEISFQKDGNLSIKADCNRVAGGYTVSDKTLTITVGPATMALCPSSSRSEEFVRLLSEAKRFVVSGQLLIVSLKDDASMGFKFPDLVDRCGKKILTPIQAANTLSPEISQKLDEALTSFVTPGPTSAPGASMLVITPKGRYFKSVGVADASTCAPLRADSPYQIGSNTKLMTSAMIYQLQEKGQLSTSDLLSKWLPDMAAKFQYGNEVTIDMLLTHTSGVLDYFDVNPGDGGIAAGIMKKGMLVRGFTPRELVDYAASTSRSNFKPGEAGKWKYCNTGYILLGLIIEKATRKTYEENLQSRIFKPLKLKKTYLQKGQPASGALPQAYYQPPFTFTTSEWNASQGWSAGAVVSTSEEFAVFLKALFTGKLFKKAETLAKLRSISEPSKNALGQGTSYGHGMLDNQGILGHGGQTLGFQSDGGFIPGKDVTIVIWSNSAANLVSRMAVPPLAKAVLGEN